VGSSGKIASNKLQELNQKVDQQLDQARDEAFDTLMHTYGLIRFILFVMDLIFFFIVIKSFAYVFARVLYSKEKGRSISLQVGNLSMLKGQIGGTGNSYSISADSEQDFYVSRIYEPAGRAPKITIPQPAKSFLARIFRRAWTMNHLVMEEGRGEIKFNAPGGKEFVEWKLAPGEVVIFHYRNFVAMSESIQLSTLFSLRLTSLLFGRMIFSAAQGPGTLVLTTKGKAQYGAQEAAGLSVPESRLMAWQKNASFYVESELNVFDVFFSGVYLKRLDQDLLIVDSDQIGKAKSGIFKFFKHFLLPI
ncbi:MAG: AIM24 family protein, partial [Bacteroidota bacterium]